VARSIHTQNEMRKYTEEQEESSRIEEKE